MTQWLPHDGGPCPVAPDTMVIARYRTGIASVRPILARELWWNHVDSAGDIVGYIPHVPAPDPRDAEIARLRGEVERLRDALEEIAGIGFDCPATWGGTDEAWERNRANIMQRKARAALTKGTNDE